MMPRASWSPRKRVAVGFKIAPNHKANTTTDIHLLNVPSNVLMQAVGPDTHGRGRPA